MSVLISLRNAAWQEIITFPWEEIKTIFQQAKEHGVDLPISCGVGVCWFCRTKILQGKEYIDIGKKSMPLKELAEDEVFICVGGILSSALSDREQHIVILQTKL